MFKHRQREIEGRATLYLSIIVIRFALIGFLCLHMREDFSQAYAVIGSIAPFPLWGTAMLLISFGAFLSIIIDRARLGRTCVVASATITAFWGFSLIGAYVDGHLATSPVGPIIWLSVAAKDLIVASMPFSYPVENILKKKPDLAKQIAASTKDGGKWM